MAAFDRTAYGEKIRMALAQRQVSLRSAAGEAGVSASVLSRALNGLPFDVAAYHQIQDWLELAAEAA